MNGQINLKELSADEFEKLIQAQSAVISNPQKLLARYKQFRVEPSIEEQDKPLFNETLKCYYRLFSFCDNLAINYLRLFSIRLIISTILSQTYCEDVRVANSLHTIYLKFFLTSKTLKSIIIMLSLASQGYLSFNKKAPWEGNLQTFLLTSENFEYFYNHSENTRGYYMPGDIRCYVRIQQEEYSIPEQNFVLIIHENLHFIIDLLISEKRLTDPAASICIEDRKQIRERFRKSGLESESRNFDNLFRDVESCYSDRRDGFSDIPEEYVVRYFELIVIEPESTIRHIYANSGLSDVLRYIDTQLMPAVEAFNHNYIDLFPRSDSYNLAQKKEDSHFSLRT